MTILAHFFTNYKIISRYNNPIFFLLFTVTSNSAGFACLVFGLKMETNLSYAAKVISSILKHDKKINSYKIALMRSINDVVLSYPDLYEYKTAIAIPLRIIAEYWLSYYWPFANPENPIFQGPRAQRDKQIINDVSFRPELEKLHLEWKKVIKSAKSIPSDGFFIQNEMRISRKRKEYPKEFLSSYSKALKKITNAIKMPIRYAGEGEWQIFDQPIAFSNFKNEAVGIPGTRQNDVCFLLPNELWGGFHQLSLYIEALSIHQWSLFLESVKQTNKDSINRGKIYEILTSRPNNRRPLTWERNNIDILIMEGLRFRCPWTKRILDNPSGYDLDHIVPISLYPINELWNLVPSDPTFNTSKKRDKLPGINAINESTPIIKDIYCNYLQNEELSRALHEDSINRFSRISNNNFSTENLADSMKQFVVSFQMARNVATF